MGLLMCVLGVFILGDMCNLNTWRKWLIFAAGCALLQFGMLVK